MSKEELSFIMTTSDVDEAITFVEKIYDFNGELWEEVKRSRDMKQLRHHLMRNGVAVTLRKKRDDSSKYGKMKLFLLSAISDLLFFIIMYSLISFCWISLELVTVGEVLPSSRDTVIAVILSLVFLLAYKIGSKKSKFDSRRT